MSGPPLPSSPDWRRELRELASGLASSIAGELSERALRVVGAIERVVERDLPHVTAYRGYGTAQRALVLGRVMRDVPLTPPEPGRARWRNLVDTLRRIDSDPVPHARVRAHAAERGIEQELEGDDEGFLRSWVSIAPERAPGFAPGWHTLELTLVAPAAGDTEAAQRAARATGQVLIPPPAASFGVVSDLDDTVIQSEVTNFIRAARIVLLENALTRLPFPGVAAFYRALQRGPSGGDHNPIFYVSSSPWNLHDLIDEFLEKQQIPVGPMLLRDWDLSRLSTRHGDHKLGAIREILATYPGLRFVLVGDSGQEDPEIYSTIVREHPGRILAIYIRNVTPRPERSSAIRTLAEEVREAGSTLVLADDTLAAARHAAAHEWIPSSVLAEIGGEKAHDEGATAAKAEAPGVETPRAPSPTIVVDPDVSAQGIE
jgi:phosphatidate phosphatase APP1